MRFNIDGFNAFPESEYFYITEPFWLISEKVENIAYSNIIQDSMLIFEYVDGEISATTFNVVTGDSRFNQAVFNTAAFNEFPEDYRVIYDDFTVFERIVAAIGISKIIDDSMRIVERTINRARLSIIIPETMNLVENIDSKDIESRLFLWDKDNFAESISNFTHIGKTIHEYADMLEVIDTFVHIGKIMHTFILIDEMIDNTAHIGKIIHENIDINEIVINFIRMALRAYQSFHLDTEMPPGSEIRIDSNNNTVKLSHNGVTTNIRPRFSGNWIHFDRNIQRLYIENQGSALDGDVVYNDRWL